MVETFGHLTKGTKQSKFNKRSPKSTNKRLEQSKDQYIFLQSCDTIKGKKTW